ncbi:MAG: zinc-dependent alcohol dehydrogenase family protein [Sneathiella sp.]|uniref:zinc-dependent alcohol dehydrogenase family protein n=1 Tax=Sneathiella sp. TaxID=1964365 RepID=UPI003001240D
MVKIAQFHQFGPAAKVIELAEQPDISNPEGDQLVVKMLAMSINPADILTIEGDYGIRPELPNIPGAEGVGRIIKIGPAVKNLQAGDLVLPFGGGAWRESMMCREGAVIPLPADIDIDQAAMIKANPATAEIMLTSLVSLKDGDWVIQNASNSAVGRYVIKIAKRKNLKVIAIARRADVVEMLKADGADVVIVADEKTDAVKMSEEMSLQTGGELPKLALDAVGGYASNQLAKCLADGGYVVNYGLLSGEPCKVDPFDLVFRRIELKGFWLADWFKTASRDDILSMYGALIPLVMEGVISGAIEAKYPLDDVKQAVAHAAKPHRSGKILLTEPNTIGGI